jgi:hypothetical protein
MRMLTRLGISMLLICSIMGLYHYFKVYVPDSYGLMERKGQYLIPHYRVSDSSDRNIYDHSDNRTTLDEGKYLIELTDRKFTPTPGIHLPPSKMLTPTNESTHFLLQLYELPNSEQRKKNFEDPGIKILDYLTGNTYIASAKITDVPKVENNSEIRWAGPLLPTDKISNSLRNGTIGSWAYFPNRSVVLTIQLHIDENISDFSSTLKKYKGNIITTVPDLHIISASFPAKDISGNVEKLASEDPIQFIDIPSPPLDEQNDGARTASNISKVSNDTSINGITFPGLSGKGIISLIYDSGKPDYRHPDFKSRVIQMDQSGDLKDHATSVTGSLGGSGINSNGLDSHLHRNGGTPKQWKGMAPEVLFRTFVFNGSDTLYDDGKDLSRDFHTAENTKGGIDLASMSIGNNIVENNFSCDSLGDYSNTAILIDNIVYGNNNFLKIPLFKSIGNELMKNAPCGTYHTITTPATSKNSISVGAINSDDHNIYINSSWGPTDDGRLKPDIVAPGCESGGDKGITTTIYRNVNYARNGYYGYKWCGTSFATPIAAGSGALLLEEWHRLMHTRPEPSTIKALLIHTSTDLGNSGPDYKFGWGAVNGGSAINLLRHSYLESHNSIEKWNLLGNDRIDTGENRTYKLSSDGLHDVKVTVAWDDPPASRISAKNLINNIDLALIDPNGTFYLSFVLDPHNPASVATRGVDSTNNVEMSIGNAKKGTWLVHVNGRCIPEGPQLFSLVSSDKLELPPNIK